MAVGPHAIDGRAIRVGTRAITELIVGSGAGLERVHELGPDRDGLIEVGDRLARSAEPHEGDAARVVGLRLLRHDRDQVLGVLECPRAVADRGASERAAAVELGVVGLARDGGVEVGQRARVVPDWQRTSPRRKRA